MTILRTSVARLKELLLRLGVAAGGVTMVHSSLLSFGILEGGPGGMYRALREILGPDGTLIVPTFTYSFQREEVFDIRKTPAPKVLGSFSEYVRILPQAVRSADPLFSMAAVGPRALELMRRESVYCFGKGSIYEKVFDADTLILALGITYDTGITAFMHLERLAGVDYRHDLLLRGTSVDAQGHPYADSGMHFARNAEKYPEGRRNRIPFGGQMESRGVARIVELGNSRHVALPAKSFLAYTLERLAADPYAMFVPNKD